MGITASKPKIIVLDNDKTETYAQILRQALNVQTQIVVCICPTARDDRYNTIKKICCAESPIPSQVNSNNEWQFFSQLFSDFTQNFFDKK